MLPYKIRMSILQTCRVYDAHIGWLLTDTTNLSRLRRSYLIWGYWFYKHVASTTLTHFLGLLILQTCRVYDAHIGWLLTDSTNIPRLRRSYLIWGYWYYKHVASTTLTLVDCSWILQTFRVYDAHTFFGVTDTTNMSRLRRSEWLITDGFYKHIASATLQNYMGLLVLQTYRVQNSFILFKIFFLLEYIFVFVLFTWTIFTLLLNQ